MYACPNCHSTDKFMAFKDGIFVKVLEDHEDVEGLENVQELLCADCNTWFPNPTRGKDPHARILTGELVTLSGLNGRGTIKVVATGKTLAFHYDTYEQELADMLADEDPKFIRRLKEFTSHKDHHLGLRVKEEGNPNTWLYRVSRRKLWKRLGL